MAKALVDHPSYRDRDLAVRGGTLTALRPRGQGDEVPKANALGMTETLGPHSMPRPDQPADRADSFGRSVPGVEHKVVDPVTGEDLPPGEVGELWLRGYPVMLGFHKVEREDVFTPDGWYRTGDGGHLDADGHFCYRGRLGDVVKSSGVNVTPRDVELELEALPGGGARLRDRGRPPHPHAGRGGGGGPLPRLLAVGRGDPACGSRTRWPATWSPATSRCSPISPSSPGSTPARSTAAPSRGSSTSGLRRARPRRAPTRTGGSLRQWSWD